MSSEDDEDDYKVVDSHTFMCNRKLKEAGHELYQGIWKCKCGHDAFYLLATCYQCQSCGQVHTFDGVHGSM